MQNLLDVSLLNDEEVEEEDTSTILARLRKEHDTPPAPQPPIEASTAPTNSSTNTSKVPLPQSTRKAQQLPPPTRKTNTTPVPIQNTPRNLIGSHPCPPPQTIYVANRQQQNPVIQHVKNVKPEFRGDIIPDFILNDTTCALFISIAYHLKKEDYLWKRIQSIPSNSFALTLILCHVDTVRFLSIANISARL
jgi:DNA excision repair protein ERCC-1